MILSNTIHLICSVKSYLEYLALETQSLSSYALIESGMIHKHRTEIGRGVVHNISMERIDLKIVVNHNPNTNT